MVQAVPFCLFADFDDEKVKFDIENSRYHASWSKLQAKANWVVGLTTTLKSALPGSPATNFKPCIIGTHEILFSLLILKAAPQ